MPCLSPLQIVNPTKILSLDGGSPFLISVPCGHCAACQKTRHDEYFFRAYYQGLSTLRSGGFVYMHDLTYNNRHLPRISDFFDTIPRRSSYDFPCFSYRDIRRYLLRVREKLYRSGYDIKGKLNYLITSEYGGKNTRRPHYHVLWYVNFSIDPYVFSRLVGSVWYYGYTDTARHMPREYVTKYIFLPNGDLMSVARVCNYVSKYVLKSSEFDKLVKSRLYKLLELDTGLSGDDLINYVSTDGRELFRSYYRQIAPFHRQGNGFGADFTICNDLQEVLRTGMISIPDKNRVLKHIPLPLYYKRRLFYEMVKDFRGVRCWKLNDLGRDWFLNRALESTKHLADTFRDWFNNLSLYLPKVREGFDSAAREEFHNNLIHRVYELLGNRSWLDFATYIGIYKGRVNSPDGRFRIFLEDAKVDSFDTWLCGYLPDNDNFNEGTYSYTTRQDSEALGERLLCSYWLGSSVTGYVKDPRKFITDKNSMKLSDFITAYVINDESDPRFKGFDELYSIYLETCAMHEEQITYAEGLLQHIQQFFKTISL